MSTQDNFYSSVDTSQMDKVLSGAILYTIDTSLSEESKRIARQNINAVSEDQHFTILGFFDTVEELPSEALTGDAYCVKVRPKYQMVEYLESTGTQYIDAGIVVDSFDVDFQFTQEYSGNTVYSVLGSRTAENTNIFCVGHWAGSLYMCPPNMPVAAIDLNRHHVQNGSYFENQAIYDETVAGTYESYDVTEDQNIYLFSENRGPTYPLIYGKSSCRIYSAKLYANGVLVRDFEPCYRTFDNVPGLLDKVNNVFYANNGTGDFLVGSDITETDAEDIITKYDIYVWDGINRRWMNIGGIHPKTNLIEAASTDAYHTLTSFKINQLFNDFTVDTYRLDDEAVNSDKIRKGSVSAIYQATIATSSWIGEEVSEYLSPDGSSNDYVLHDKPSELIRLEFLSAHLILEPNVDYIYTASTGNIHFRETPVPGSQTYEVVYHSTQPPYNKNIPISGIKATDKPIISVLPSKTDDETAKNQLNSWDEIYSITPYDGGLLAKASFHTTVPIPIQVLCIRK